MRRPIGRLVGPAAGVALIAAAPAPAAEVTEPVDGARVSSRPTFVVSGGGPPGSLSGEVATDATVRTAGDRPGSFVEPLDSFIEFFGDDPLLPPNHVRWDSTRLSTGRYFWHAQVHMYEDSAADQRWSPTRTFTVVDEPVVLEGWTARARTLKRRAGCATRRHLAGRIAFDDNARPEEIRWVARVYAGSRQIGRLTGKAVDGTADWSGVVCAGRRRLEVRLTIRDPGGHRVDDRKMVSIPPSSGPVRAAKADAPYATGLGR